MAAPLDPGGSCRLEVELSGSVSTIDLFATSWELLSWGLPGMARTERFVRAIPASGGLSIPEGGVEHVTRYPEGFRYLRKQVAGPREAVKALQALARRLGGDPVVITVVRRATLWRWHGEWGCDLLDARGSLRLEEVQAAFDKEDAHLCRWGPRDVLAVASAMDEDARLAGWEGGATHPVSQALRLLEDQAAGRLPWNGSDRFFHPGAAEFAAARVVASQTAVPQP